MDSNFFQFPNVPKPWNLFYGWSDEENSGKHGIHKKEITSECFYYLEVLTDLLQKYSAQYYFEKLPGDIMELAFEQKDYTEGKHYTEHKVSERINFSCPTFQTINLEQIKKVITNEFLTAPPTDQEIQACASCAITLSLYKHISWVLLEIDDWISERNKVSQPIIDSIHLYVERNWRKVPE